MDGNECVKRALCETQQQRSAGEPDSFLAEIMRAVFTMPTHGDVHGDGADANNRSRFARASAADIDPLHREYDEALAHGRLAAADCGHQFGRCEGSIWSGAFAM